MALIVMKFGGSSLESDDKIEAAVSVIEKYVKNGDSVVAVVSARGDTTDRLLKMADKAGADTRETDALIACGEQMSAAVCAMALIKRGIPAVSLTGAQAGISTEGEYGDANVATIDCRRLKYELDKGRVPVVAGFQGHNNIGDTTTLGRGGSDTTAVCLAAFLNADKCLLFKDVDGIYTSDPKKDPYAVKYGRISYDDMEKLAARGDRVLHKKCIAYAKKYGVVINVMSIENSDGGTIVE